MSEYQYYEYLAIDEPLDEEAIEDLRAFSTRAKISPTHFCNYYDWGDLKVDPLEVLLGYFDVFLYVSSWGAHRVVFRFHKEDLDLEEAVRFLPGDRSALSTYQKLALVEVAVEAEEVERRFGASLELDATEWENDDGSGWMASIAPLREEILRGDRRPLYLAWLSALQMGEVDEDAEEPPVPPALGALSEAQEQLADFLFLDPHLLAVAAEASLKRPPSMSGLEGWIRALPIEEKDRLLHEVAEGDQRRVGASLVRRFLRQQEAEQAGKRRRPKAPRRAGALLEAARERRSR